MKKLAEKNIAIVLAAGKGRRMRSEVPKQFMELDGKPILYYSLQAFQKNSNIHDVILVIDREYQDFCREQILKPYELSKVSKLVEGGAERYDSVYAGLEACTDCRYVFIHDGARPFVTDDIINRCMDAVKRDQACVVGMPVKDTIKIIDEHGYIAETPAREKMWLIQTPQVFSYELIFRAYSKMLEDVPYGITDDAMVLEEFGETKVSIIEGAYENIKITTPEDIQVARNIILNQ